MEVGDGNATETQTAAAAQQDVPKFPMTSDIFEADNFSEMLGWTAVNKINAGILVNNEGFRHFAVQNQ